MYVLQCHQDQTWDWFEWNAKGECVSQKHCNDLSDVPHPPRDAPLAVLIPGDSVLMTSVKLPKMRAGELAKAAPYALEEQLASDPDSVLVATGSQLADGKTITAVIEKSLLENALTQWREHHLFPQVVLPDFLAIKYELNAWTIVLQNQYACVRIAPDAGFLIEADNLTLLLQTYFQQKTKPAKIICFQDGAIANVAALEKFSIPVDYRDAKNGAYFDIPSLFSAHAFNLLQGRLRAQTPSSALKKRWSTAAVSAGIFVGFLFLSQIGQWIYFSSQVKKLQSQVMVTYRQLFPKATDVLEPHFRTTQLLKRFQLAEKESTFFRLLAITGKALLDFPHIHLKTIAYQPQQLTLTITTQKLSLLSGWADELRAQQLVVQQQVLKTDATSVAAQVTISEKTT